MLRWLTMLLLVPLCLGATSAIAQSKKSGGVGKIPTANDRSIYVTTYMRDAGKNEILLATRIFPDFPDYNTAALQRYFAMMKALEPTYKQDDDVAYTWAKKEKVTKCSIYLESDDAGAKSGTGAVVGCEANGVSSLAAMSTTGPKVVSASQSSKHLADVMDLFKTQSERAKHNIPK
ncbi:MAG: hypothetical protein ABI777_11170 [Betaproteobacteria bacterium]